MKKILLFFIATLLFSQCKHDCTHYNYGKIMNVERPEKAKANEVLPIEILVELDASCETAHAAYENGFGTHKRIRVSILNNECDCKQQYEKVKVIYSFLPEFGVGYVLEYQSVGTPSILDTINVDW